MTIKDKQTHEQDALNRLPNQFIDSPNLRKLVSINASRTQGLNDELIKILDGVSIMDAIGKQLDNIATFFDLVRIVGESDSDFRARILAESAILSRSGESKYIIDSYILLTGASSVLLQDIYPAGFQIVASVSVDAEDADIDAAILNSMNEARAGAVDMILVISTETDYFFFDSEANVDASGNGTSDISGGFGSATDSDGGQLARVLK